MATQPDGEGVSPRHRLGEVLERARQLGFLGPGPVDEQIVHARGFVAGLELERSSGAPLGRIADLGAGGGVPGLVIVAERADAELVLIDASQRRCSFLVWATVELGVAERTEVRRVRAEVLGHAPGHREHYDAVVARGFGPPGMTVECAAPLLRLGGRCVISEPPGGRSWPAHGLGAASMRLVGRAEGTVVLERHGPLRPDLPRPAKAQRRAPLFAL